ncbi:MAG: hypothetical protein GXO27_02380 [Chlorobi bacterium]|nr:hypothetical protein [Chlorobiota bacterium]
MENSSPVRIDIERIIRSRPEPYFRYMPGFLIGMLKRLIREREMNEVLARIGHLKNFDFIEAAVREMDMKVEARGTEHIPRHGHVIFVGNHALGGADFFALMHVLKDFYPKVYHLANDVLMSFTPLKEMFLPVKVFGRNPDAYRRQLKEKLRESGVPVSLFPSGEVARYRNGVWDDGLWRSGFVRFAREYGRWVVPFFVPTRNSPRFYKLHRLRSRLGIRANLELFLLPSELMHMRGKKVEIVFGEPLPPSFFARGDIHELSARVKEMAYALGGLRPA